MSRKIPCAHPTVVDGPPSHGVTVTWGPSSFTTSNVGDCAASVGWGTCVGAEGDPQEIDRSASKASPVLRSHTAHYVP